MKFYLINPYFDLLTKMEDAGFTGVLLTYHSKESDYFIKVAREIDIHKKIKYMIAIRPHLISPEYLVRLTEGIKEISEGDRLQINLVSGAVDEEEYLMDRTLGPITNKSTTQERSNYLIEYIKLLNQLPEDKKPDYYVSATNDFTIKAALAYNDKIMIPYHKYIHDKNILTNKKVMVYLAPILRKTQEELDTLTGYNIKHIEDVKFTFEGMSNLINKLKNEGIEEMMLSAWSDEDIKINIDFIREYNQEKGKK
jgi:hypothetical protein